MTNTPGDNHRTRPDWVAMVKKYQKSNTWRSIWQIVNSAGPFFLIWVLMYQSLKVSYWLTLGLALLNAGFIMRIFIIQHDCGHNSFFKSRKVNDIVGSIFGVLTLTPYFQWRKDHAKHHATSGDLDFRGIGDVATLTVAEFEALGRWEQFKYRFYRHPLVLFLVGPVAIFVFAHRIPSPESLKKKGDKKERRSVYWTNTALAAIAVAMGLWIGFKDFIIVQAPITLFSAVIGVYLFYVQHQFEDTYWRRHVEWDYEKAALEGSSYFKLPRLFQWFSGNIGFHHVHHLSPKIPNYLLERAHSDNEIFQKAETITLATSIKTIFLHLWDESQERLISFREYRRRYAGAGAAA